MSRKLQPPSKDRTRARARRRRNGCIHRYESWITAVQSWVTVSISVDVRTKAAAYRGHAGDAGRGFALSRLRPARSSCRSSARDQAALGRKSSTPESGCSSAQNGAAIARPDVRRGRRGHACARLRLQSLRYSPRSVAARARRLICCGVERSRDVGRAQVERRARAHLAGRLADLFAAGEHAERAASLRRAMTMRVPASRLIIRRSSTIPFG